MVETFGVYQDANVTKYVTLVGAVLALQSTRPGLDWQFVVLDTEGVNAFAAPGGFIHITKGLLGLMKNEAELAGVLAHEIIHVTEKHTVNAIQKGDAVKVAVRRGRLGGGMAQSLVAKMAEKAYSDILNNKFSRNDEGEADEKGITLANKVGYAPVRLELGADQAVRSQQGREGAERAVRVAPAAEGANHQDRHDDQREEARRDGHRSGALRQEHHLRRQAGERAGDGRGRLARARGGGEEKKPADDEDRGRREEEGRNRRRAAACSASCGRAAARRRSSRRRSPRPAREESIPIATPSAAPTRSACQ